VIDKTDYKIQKADTDCKELYIEPASYILNDDSHSFLPPSKALVLGLLPLVSVGVFYSGVFDDALTVDAHYETHELSLPLSVAAPLVVKHSIGNASSHHILNIADQKPTIGAQDFQLPLLNGATDHKHKAFAIKKVLAKEVSMAIKKPLTKPPLLRKMEQQHVRLQQKTMLSNIVKGRQKSKVTFLASKASTVRLVSSKPTKKVVPMGVLNIRSRLVNKQGRVVKASYFIIQHGKRVKQKVRTQSAVFKLPIGEYTIQAIYKGNVMQKQAVVEKSHVDKLTFIYSEAAKVSSSSVEKKAVSTGKIVVMSHDKEGHSKVLPVDYFVYKNGQEVLHETRSSVTNFQLPVGHYVLRAVRSRAKGRAVIREMAIVIKSDSVIFPVFIFAESDATLKKEAGRGLAKQGKQIQGDDLTVLAELVLRNEEHHQYASSDYLELMSKHALPTGIGYSGTKR